MKNYISVGAQEKASSGTGTRVYLSLHKQLLKNLVTCRISLVMSLHISLDLFVLSCPMTLVQQARKESHTFLCTAEIRVVSWELLV